MVNARSFLLAAAVTTVAVAAPLEQPRAAGCASGVYMIVARGSGEPVGQGKPGNVAALVAQRVPGSASVAVDYPASILKRDEELEGRNVEPRVLYPVSVSDGITDTKKKVQDYVAKCGNASKIALIGFSQGGNVITDMLVGGVLKPAPIDDKYLKNIIAVTVFGDPTFAPNQTYDRGSNAHGQHGGLFSRSGNAGEIAKLNAMADKLASYCDTDDIVCAGGSSTAVHSAEVDTHAQDAADFIVARAKK
ncbi:acetyl xylan esterase [Cordyceps fumosorosea ARSEF 2679]|uniref:Acetyl xylan esterase n=1 Tax=Cordyceps fumosorosea (strain ARSEF 2679) TaxID=1081104 RepID=A0A167S7T4_CORFA|nr:acetyl xylan esterase [Cordyceps fumosorosea ARSEF 2679]OAA59347.1 acetyl xylan esterase [Cordyceps fumosorosea ARSEF 2679]